MRIATDIGGTFTDPAASERQGKVYTVKGDTTPPASANFIIQEVGCSHADPRI